MKHRAGQVLVMVGIKVFSRTRVTKGMAGMKSYLDYNMWVGHELKLSPLAFGRIFLIVAIG